MRSWWQWLNARPSPNMGLARYIVEYGFVRIAVIATLLSELIVKPLSGAGAPFAQPQSTLVLFLIWGVVFGVVGWVRNIYLPRLDVKD